MKSNEELESSLQSMIFELMMPERYMFYGLFLAELNKIFSDKMPTACVGKHINSPNITLILGPEFWEKTCSNDSMKKGVLIHELEHIIREHLTDGVTGMMPDKLISNMAQDMSINQCITEQLPREHNGERCGVFFDDYAKDLGLKPNESSLYYYHILKAAKDKKKESKGKGEDSKNPKHGKGNGRGTSGCQALDEFLDAEEDGKMQDWHASWKDITAGMNAADVNMMKKEIQEQIRRVADETQKCKGIVPVHITDAVKDDFGNKPPIISWKTLFNRFIGSTINTDIYQTRKRPNFRFEDAPSNKYKTKVKIVVGMDSSGSVSDHELDEFFAQAKHMYNAGVKIDICLWDSHVHKEYEYKGENVYERVCQGGTHASCFIEHVNKNARKSRWTCAINLTDGYIENEPIPCDIPLLWVITESGSSEFKHKSKKIKMN